MSIKTRIEDAERLAAGEKVRQWEPFRRQAEKRLRILDTANSFGDLAALNSNRLRRESTHAGGVHGSTT
jgi:plasmid maintenance system killer protein